MNRDQEFETWWQAIAYPQIIKNFILLRHIDEIKKSAKQCWDASWQAAQQKSTDPI